MQDVEVRSYSRHSAVHESVALGSSTGIELGWDRWAQSIHTQLGARSILVGLAIATGARSNPADI